MLSCEAVDGVHSVTTVIKGTFGSVGIEIGNLLPLVQVLTQPRIWYFQLKVSATLSALVEGFHSVRD